MEPAKPDYRQRLAVQELDDLGSELSAALKTSERAQQPAGHSDVPQLSTPIHLPSRDGRKVIHL